MANTKVSAFTAASALGGTEVVGGVQGGANAKITIDQIKTYCRSRVDVLLDSDTKIATREGSQSNHIVRTAAGVYYAFWIANENVDLYYRKSTNYGVTWTAPVLVKAETMLGVAVWFDKWTPGDNGTAIHLAYYGSGANDVFYRRLDTADDSFGTELTVFNGVSAVSGANSCLSIAKAKGGKIHVAFDIDGGTEVGHYKSDVANTPTSFATTDGSGALNEGASTDYYALFPANLADTADIWAVFWDRSANEVTVKTFDDSGSSWTAIAESTAITSMVDITTTTAAPQFAGAIRNTDGHLMLVAWLNADTASATLRFWDVTGNGASAATLAAPVTIVTSTDDQALCAIGVDTTSDDLYCFYAGKTDGSETAFTALNIYYKISTDDGATWGAETVLSSMARAVTLLNCALETSGGDFAVMFGGVETIAGIGLYVSAWR